MSKPGDQTPTDGPDQDPLDPDFDQTLPEGAFDKTLPEDWIDPVPGDDGATTVNDLPADDGATMVNDLPVDDGATMVGDTPESNEQGSDVDFDKTLPEGALAILADDDFSMKTIMLNDVPESDEHAPLEDDFGKTLPDGAFDQTMEEDFTDKTMVMDAADASADGTLREVDPEKTLPEGSLDAQSDPGATIVGDDSGVTSQDDDFGKTLQADAFGKTLATDGTVVSDDEFDGKTIVGADSAVGADVVAQDKTEADSRLKRSGDSVLSSRATSTGGKTSIEGTQVVGSDSVEGIDKDSLNVAIRSISGLQYGIIPGVDFKLVKQLGEGGMGVVYVAKQQSLGREVVFKTLKPMAESQASKLKASGTMNSVIKHRTDMFLSEAVVTADLFHPNIVPIYELAKSPDGSLFYTMKWVRGDGWHQRIKDMTLEENLEVLMKVSDAMGFAHSRNIVNRDLKPENVMLGGYGETIVLDWGLALPFGEGKGRLPIATTAGLGSGTPAYMPPELITGPLARIGPACDIYLLGAMLFEVITGLPPHDFSSTKSKGTVSAGAKMAEIRRVVVDNVIRETEHTGELMDIAKKAMATKAEDRYRSVVEFQNAIRDYLKHAASHTLANRAKELTVAAAPVATGAEPSKEAPSVGYTNYQNALALYNESLREWSGNQDARVGLTETQLSFAKLALTKGDFDLGLSVLDTNADSHSETRSKLIIAREERESRVRRMKILKWTAIGLLIGFAGVSAFAAKGQFDLTAAKKQKEEAETQAGEAKIAKADAEKAAENAKKAKVEAEAQLVIADKAKVQAEMDKSAAIALKMDADKAADAAKMDAEAAVKAKELADKAKEAADKDKMVAIMAKQDAEKAADIAKKAKETAELAKTNAEQAERKAAYKARLADASRVFFEGKYSETVTKLESLKKDFDELCKEEWEQLMNAASAPQAVSMSKPVESISLSRDGRKLVTGDSAGNIVVWPIDEAGTILENQPIRRLELGSRLHVVAMSPDGGEIAAAGKDGIIRVWTLSAPANKPPVQLKGHDQAVNALKFSSDGKRLASGGDDNTIRLWSIAEARVLAHEKVLYPIQCVDWSHDGQWLVAGTSAPAEVSGVAYSWEVKTIDDQLDLELVRQFQVLPKSEEKIKQNRGVVSIALTDDGKFAVSNGPAAELHLWQVNPPTTGLKKNSLKINTEATVRLGVHSNRVERVRSVAFSADSSRLLVAGDDGTISLWSRGDSDPLPTYQRTQILYGHGGPVRNCLPLPQSPDLVISGSYDQHVNSWNVKTYLKSREWIESTKESAPPAASRPAKSEVSVLDAPFQLDCSSSGSECLDEPIQSEPESGHSVSALTNLPQSGQDSSPQENAKADPSEGEPRKSVRIAAGINEKNERIGHTDSVLSAVFSRDGKRVISSSRDQTARTWNSETGLPINTVTGMPAVFDGNTFKEGHEYDLFAMRFFPDGQRLLTSGFDGEMRIWDSRIDDDNSFGRELAMLPGTSMYGVVEISRDGEWILTAGRGNSAQLWKTEDVLKSRRPKPERVLDNVHRFRVTTVAISPDNSRLLTGDREGRIVQWDAQTGKVVGVPRFLHSGEVVRTVFLSNGSRLLTAGVDRRIVLWDVVKSDSDLQLRKVRQFDQEGMVVNLAVSPKEDRFIAVVRLGDKKTQKNGSSTSSTKTSLWEIESGDERVIDVSSPGINSQALDTDRPPFPAWAANGTLAVITTSKGIIHFYDSNTGEITNSLQVADDPAGSARRAEPYAAILRPDEPTPAHLMTQTHNAAFLWRLKDGENLVSFRPQGPVFSAGYSSDGRFVVTGGRSVRIFDADEKKITYGRLLHKVEYAHDGVATSVEFSPAENSFRFLTTSYDETAKIWEWSPDRKVAQLIHTLKGHGQPVRFGTWSADGSRVLTVGNDSLPRVWTVPSAAEPKATLLEFPKVQAEDKTDDVVRKFDQLCGAFSWDGQFVAVGGREIETGESIGWIWNLTPAPDAKPELYATVRGHGLGGINSVAFLPEDDRLLTGGNDGTARLWDWQKNQVGTNNGRIVEADFLISLVRPIKGQATTHLGAVTSVRVTRDGNMVTASSDGTVLIWPK